MKKVIVTGGAGFIGSHMVELLLKKNYKVIVLDNFSTGKSKNLSHLKKRNLIVKKIDITKLSKKSKIFKNVSYVFHFAGVGEIVPSIENPLYYFYNNIIGTIKVLECCFYNNVKKIIYAASSSCYGIAKTPTNETHKIDPQYPYALSKYIGEMCVFHWGKLFKLPYISIRIFNAYGPRVKTTGSYGAMFGVFFKQKLKEKPLTVVGDGTQKRDFLYVTDVANAFYKAAISNVKNEYFNLGAGKPVKIIDIAKKLGGKIEFIPKRPGEPKVTHANISRIKKKLKWSPKIKFEKGFNIMMKNIEDWKDAPLWNKKNIQDATKMWFKFLSK